MRILLLSMLACSLSACTLTFDLDDFPYRGEDAGAVDMGSSDEDMDTPSGPSLIFTELMINTSTTENPSQEPGEYIEVHNLGSSPVDPRDIRIDVFNADRVQPQGTIFIAPSDTTEYPDVPSGGFFFFARTDDPTFAISRDLTPGSFYIYDPNGTANTALGNSGERRLVLSLVEEQVTVELDAVRWKGGDLQTPAMPDSADPLEVVENIAFGLKPSAYGPDDNDDVTNWCYEPDLVNDASPLKGSPNASVAPNCLRFVP